MFILGIILQLEFWDIIICIDFMKKSKHLLNDVERNLTERMADIHHAIIQYMNVTLSELKRSNTTVRSLSVLRFNLIPERLS